jgi:ABC-type sugar transport system permease subunit
VSSVRLDHTKLGTPPVRIVMRRRWRSDPRWSGFLFILPFLVVFAAFGAYPLLYALRISFTNWQGTGSPRWIGLGNYTYLLTSSDFWASLRNSAVMWLLVVPIQTLSAVAAAVLLSRSRIKLKGAFRTTLIVPFVTPLVAMAQVWVLIFDQDYGVANTILHHVGLHSVGWLTTTQWAKPTLALLILWKTSGFALIIMLAAVVGIPDDVYEAAAVDGAGTVRKFWSLTIPLMRRPIAFYVVIATLGIFQLFAEPEVVTKGGPYNSTVTSGLYLYNHIANSDLGTGSANSFLLVILVFGLSLISVRLLRSKEG